MRFAERAKALFFFFFCFFFGGSFAHTQEKANRTAALRGTAAASELLQGDTQISVIYDDTLFPLGIEWGEGVVFVFAFRSIKRIFPIGTKLRDCQQHL